MDRIVEKRSIGGPKQPKATRVAAYARVSSGKDAMLHSLSAQVSHYSDLIQTHPGWMYVGVYSDEAKTGTKDTRPGFQSLLADCRAGKIDLVLVKSISRLARNTVTLLETVRELRGLGVDVYFEEQNIHTLSYEGELMLTILASYAQEEARSASENQKWRVRKNFKEGRPWNCTVLGYRSVDGTFVVEPEEAAIVRRIFSLFLDGMGVQTIANTLNAEGLRTRYGGEFNHSGLQKILRNYAYTGNLLLQKTYRPDCLTKKDYVNYGERPKYHAAKTHEPIISPEVFEQVQTELARRADVYGAEYHPANYPFTGLITCAICGKHFIRKHTRTGPTWICGTLKQRGKAACPSKQIPEATLLKLTADMDMSRITGITADNGNRLTFYLNDGSTVEKIWLDRSRSESWTDEMRKQAAEHSKKRYQKCQKET